MRTFNKTTYLNTTLNKAIADYIQKASSSEEAAQAHLFGTGPIGDLETKIASYYEMKYVLCVSNATNGLFAIAAALNLKNSRFITSPYSYGGSIASWLISGCKPVFADIDPQTLTLDPEQVTKCITPKTKAILAVDIFGNPSDTVELRKIADEFGLWYVADCAQSFGARRSGLPASHLADALVVSFTTGKTVFAGEGGAIVTNNSKLYEKLLWLTQHPYRQKRELGLDLSNEFSFNSRIHPLAAIWINVIFDSSLAKLVKYREFCFDVVHALNEIELTVPIDFAPGRIEPAFFRLSAEWKITANPSALENELEKRGINLQVSYSPIKLLYRHAAFSVGYPSLAKYAKRCRQAERQADQRFCLTSKN